MHWASAVSDNESLDAAIEECVSQVSNELGNDSPDLAVVFVSSQHATRYEEVPGLVQKGLGARVLFGCSAGGVIGGGREVEHRPGFSLTAAHLPDVELFPFYMERDRLPDADASPKAWEETINVEATKEPHFLLLADPYTFPAGELLAGLDYAFKSSVKVGGLASGDVQGAGNKLFLGDQVYQSGAIGLAMCGEITVDTVVAQGCRPIGNPMHITRCEKNLLLELDDRPTLEVLQEIFISLNERDQDLARHSLFLGVLMDEFVEEPRQGDFLIRNLIGLDPRTGAMAIGELLQEGQRVQFHLRDASTSADDLKAVLSRYPERNPAGGAQGALLFSCLGRGQYLYGRADHDTDLFREIVGPIPLGGFFCNGEIGPVGSTTYLHGYTSSFGIFHPKLD